MVAAKNQVKPGRVFRCLHSEFDVLDLPCSKIVLTLFCVGNSVAANQSLDVNKNLNGQTALVLILEIIHGIAE